MRNSRPREKEGHVYVGPTRAMSDPERCKNTTPSMCFPVAIIVLSISLSKSKSRDISEGELVK